MKEKTNFGIFPNSASDRFLIRMLQIHKGGF